MMRQSCRTNIARRLPLRSLAAAGAVFVAALFVSGRGLLPGAVRINATGGKVKQIPHDGQSAPQVFPEVKWIAINSQGFGGAVMSFDCAAFQSTLDSRSKVDVQLDLRVIRAPGDADWQVAKPTDLSNVNAGDSGADVMASTTDRGNAQFGVVVTFVNHDASMLISGDYETTLVGTITEL